VPVVLITFRAAPKLDVIPLSELLPALEA